jgi:hypothetical protein
MALRAVIDHPKFNRLKALIRCNRSVALGYLECLWHFTGRFAPAGDLGRYEDAEIEAWLEWDGPEGALIEAMIKARWIDRDPVHRLIVHDWRDHADDATRAAVKRKNLEWVTPTESGQLGQDEPQIEPGGQRCSDDVATVSGHCSDGVAENGDGVGEVGDDVGTTSTRASTRELLSLSRGARDSEAWWESHDDPVVRKVAEVIACYPAPPGKPPGVPDPEFCESFVDDARRQASAHLGEDADLAIGSMLESFREHHKDRAPTLAEKGPQARLRTWLSNEALRWRERSKTSSKPSAETARQKRREVLGL